MMNRHCSVLFCVVPLLLLTTPLKGHAQDTPPAPPANSNPTGQRSAPPRSVQVIVNQLIQETSAKIFVVSALAQQMVVVPRTTTSADSLEESLDTLVKRIPGGAWAKLYLPPSTSGRRYTGDTLAQMSAAELALFGRQAKPAPGTVVILGKQMTTVEADPYVHGLGLEPHYVIFSRRVLASPMAFNAGGGGAQGSPITDALLKQLGVASMRDVPSGNYVVSIPDSNGNPQKANIQVTNEGGKMSIRVSVEATGGPSQP